MIDTKTTNDSPKMNEIVVIISDSVIASHFRKLEKKWMITVVILVLVWTITGALFGIYITQAILTRNGTNLNASPDNLECDNVDIPLKIITRSEWIASPPEHNLTKIELPSKRVIIAHTATENCTTQASCTYRIRVIQTFHIESRKWDDIGYNFLVGGDGAVYVGRGWDIQGMHTKGYNENSICIAFIGTFSRKVPPKRQLCAAQRIIAEGIEMKKLTPDYNLYGHSQLMPTESPGHALLNEIKKWNHFTDNINRK